MNYQLTIGLVFIAAGVLFVIMAATTRGKAYEHYWGFLFVELGAIKVIPSITAPGAPQLAVQIFLYVLLAVTAFLWWKSRPTTKTDQSASGGSSASR